MGSRTDIKSSAFNIFIYNNGLRWDHYTAQNQISLSFVKGGKIKITKNGNNTVFEANGTTQTVTDNTTSFSGTSNMYIFTVNTNGTLFDPKASMKLYYFKIYQNDVLVRNFEPALDESGVACLYDKVTKQYFYNSGTGTFNYQ